jgi:hypothetical protein
MTLHTWQFNLGIFLIVLSTLLYASLIVLPFLDIPVSVKLGITPVVIIAGEIIFWIGGILVGKEIIIKYRRFFNPLHWLKRKNAEDKDAHSNDQNSA